MPYFLRLTNFVPVRKERNFDSSDCSGVDKENAGRDFFK
jgi:hypothetical protein